MLRLIILNVLNFEIKKIMEIPVFFFIGNSTLFAPPPLREVFFSDNHQNKNMQEIEIFRKMQLSWMLIRGKKAG